MENHLFLLQKIKNLLKTIKKSVTIMLKISLI